MDLKDCIENYLNFVIGHTGLDVRYTVPMATDRCLRLRLTLPNGEHNSLVIMSEENHFRIFDTTASKKNLEHCLVEKQQGDEEESLGRLMAFLYLFAAKARASYTASMLDGIRHCFMFNQAYLERAN